MTTSTASSSTARPLRLWPGVALAVTLVLVKYVAPVLGPEAEIFSVPVALIGVLGGMFLGLAIFLWWLLFSRARWSERLLAIAVIAVLLYITSRIVHVSIAGGMMGMMLPAYSLPLVGVALVAWAAAAQRLTGAARFATLVAAIALACAPWTLLRTAGSLGAGAEFHWRWTPTPEERLLASDAGALKQVTPAPAPAAPAAPAPAAPQASSEPGTATVPPAPAAKPEVTAKTEAAPSVTPAAPVVPAEWPGFRGADRDSVVHGLRINTDWSSSPPVEIWRRAIGPGWSSFSVRGDLLYTQEQRGEDELVAAYRVSTGEPVWRHRDPVRFWESNGGAGPRATPTISNDRVYAFGATGILNALDADTGKLLWSRNVATDTGRRVPDWGFSSSPLVIDGVVIVAASGTMAAYDAATGNKRWVGARQLGSYSSPHDATIDGVRQVLLLSGSGAASFAPATGALLWHYNWGAGGATIVQPALTDNGDVLVNALAMTGGEGMRRLTVTQKSGAWTIEEKWLSNGLKPYFNDFVVHKGHAFGFDGAILSCIDLQDGKRKWKGGRYGNGQLVLLEQQDLLLVVSEEGELALVSATTDQYRELARLPALNGKTWNHPVVVKNLLLVRNGEEMAAFRLAPEAGASTTTDARTRP